MNCHNGSGSHLDPPSVDNMSQKILEHIMNLFDCTGLVSVIPTFNKIYGSINEFQNFFNDLKDILALEKNDGYNVCISKIKYLVNFKNKLNMS